MIPMQRSRASLDDLLSLAVECHAIDRYREEPVGVWIQMDEEEYRIPFDSVRVFIETVIQYRRRMGVQRPAEAPERQPAIGAAPGTSS